MARVFAIGRAVASMVATCLVSSAIVFLALAIAPGSELAVILGADASSATPAQIAAVKQQYDLGHPIWQQYAHWLVNVLQGHLGQSAVFRENVTQVLAPRLAITGTLVIYAAVLMLVGGVLLGVLSTVVPRWLRWFSPLTTTLGFAIPSFILGILLATVFGLYLHLLPVAGAGTGLLDRIEHLTLPAVSLAAGGGALIARLTQTSMMSEEGAEHVLAATMRGASRALVVRNHILRNALAPVITISGLSVAALIAGTVVIETTFGISGIGALLVSSVESKDIPVVQAIALMMVTAYVVVSAFTEILYPFLDPRVRERTD